MTQSAERKVTREPVKQPEAAPPKPPTSTRYSTTMAELGDKMPIGILDGEGRLHKDIVTKPWKTRDERELGKKLGSDAQISDHVPIVIANMCSRIGPHNMDTLDDPQKSLIVSTMYMADVFYLYALLRMKAMGPRLPLTVNCPRGGCGVTFPYIGDLTSVEVVAVDDIDDRPRQGLSDLARPRLERGKGPQHRTGNLGLPPVIHHHPLPLADEMRLRPQVRLRVERLAGAGEQTQP